MSRVELSEELYWNAPGDLFAFTVGGDYPPHMLVPPGIATFTGTSIEAGVCACMMLRDKSGTVVGFGSELEVRPSSADKDAPVDVYFTIVLPGRGTLFLQEFKKSEIPNSSAADEILTVKPTVGPGKDGRSVVISGTGEFEGVQGSHYQEVHISHLNPDAPAGETHKAKCVERFQLSLPKR